MADVEYEVIEVDLTPKQAEQVAAVPGVIQMQEVKNPFNVSFRDVNKTSKQKMREMKQESERLWSLFQQYIQGRNVPYDEGCVKTWIELQVWNDATQRGDWCPRCKKVTRGTVGCGTEGCKLGEYQMDYYICNIPKCTHYLHVAQGTDPSGTRRCFEHHLM